MAANKTILIYGLTGMELLKMGTLCKAAGIRLRAVAPSQTSYTVTELLSGAALPPAEPYAMNGKYALLDGFAGNLDEASGIINQVSSGVIKAMHTMHNSSWRFSDLCFAIQQEQNALEKIKKSRMKK